MAADGVQPRSGRPHPVVSRDVAGRWRGWRRTVYSHAAADLTRSSPVTSPDGGADGGGRCPATPPPLSQRHLLAQRGKPLVADPGDLAELLDRAEPAALLAEVEDL